MGVYPRNRSARAVAKPNNPALTNEIRIESMFEWRCPCLALSDISLREVAKDDITCVLG